MNSNLGCADSHGSLLLTFTVTEFQFIRVVFASPAWENDANNFVLGEYAMPGPYAQPWLVPGDGGSGDVLGEYALAGS